MIINIAIQELQCPKCKSLELHPNKDQVLIRAYKVDNWSHCLVCAGYYLPDLTVNPNPPDNYRVKGWFE